MITSLLALLAALQPMPGVQGRDPRFWPTPVMDTTPPELPELRPGAVLVLSKTNGFRNDAQIKAATARIEEVVRKSGRDVFATENAAVMNPADLAKFSVVVLNSTSGNIFTDEQRQAFRAWVEGGGGVVLLHGAGGDSKYDWSWYPEALLGALFIDHTSAPEQFQQGTIHVVEPGHPVMKGIPRRWTRIEEWYSFSNVPAGSGTRILATLDESSYRPSERLRMGDVHPVVWTRCVEKGRAVFSALGHQAEAYDEPLHLRLIGNAIRWAAGKEC